MLIIYEQEDRAPINFKENFNRKNLLVKENERFLSILPGKRGFLNEDIRNL
jgi:hypothetical protein